MRLFVGLACALICEAQTETASLSVKVFDITRARIGDPRSVAWLYSEISDWRASIKGSITGEFRFENVPSGTYRLEVQSPGFLTARIVQIQLAPGDDRTVPDITLVMASSSCGFFLDTTRFLVPEDHWGSLIASVLDEGGRQPVGEVHVSLNCAGCKAATGADGQFSFSKLSPGTYTLSLSKKGFYPFQSRGYYTVRGGAEQTYSPIYLESCPKGNCSRPKTFVRACE